MAIVSGQSLLSGHNLAELDPAANSDDEYDYVSSLAEQIAHAMLDEEEALEKENAFCSESPSHSMYGNSFLTRASHGSAASTANANPWNSGGWRWPEQQQQQQQVRGNGFHENLRAAAQVQQSWEARNSPYLSHSNCNTNNTNYHLNGIPHNRSAFSTANVNEMIATQRLRRMVNGRSFQSNGCWNQYDARVNTNVNNAAQSTSPPAQLNPNSVIFRKESVGTGVFLPRVKAFTPPRRNKSSSSSDLSSQKSYPQDRRQNNHPNRSPSSDTSF